MKKYSKKTFTPITLADVENVWGNANFGAYSNDRKMNVVGSALLKWACGFSTGYTAFSILVDLGLITKKKRLTVRGKRQLWEFYGSVTDGTYMKVTT